MKNKIFYLFLFVIFLTSCVCKRVNNLQDVEESIKIGNKLAENIEKFQNKYGDYPEKLDDLVPEFYEKAPKTKMKYLNNKSYNYRVFYYNKNLILNNIRTSGIFFNASISSDNCQSLSSDTCSYIFINSINKNIILNEKSIYKNWQYNIYFPYNNCKHSSEQLKCIFKNQLKCKYQKVEVNSE